MEYAIALVRSKYFVNEGATTYNGLTGENNVDETV
jgi:hypothetical protein